MASHDVDDEMFWSREEDPGADVWQEEIQNTDPERPPVPRSAAAPSAVQPTITHFFGARESDTRTGITRITADSRARPGSSSSTPVSRGETVAAANEASSSASTSTSCHKNDFDQEVAELSPEDKEKVYSPTSLVWMYFTKDNKDKATCKHCETSLNTPTGATTLLIRHLHKCHLLLHNNYTRLNNIRNKIALKRAQEKAKTQAPDKKRLILFPLDSKSKKAEQITNAIAMFMVKGLQPYSVVEEMGFHYLLFVLEPRYVIPSRTTFSRNIIPKMYQGLKNHIQIKLKDMAENNELESISITIDAWTSRKMDPFLAFTLQFVNSTWKMERHTLDLDPFPGSHTADIICERLDAKLVEYHLNGDEINKYVTSDNGSNMLAALEQPSQQRMLDQEIAQILRERKSWEHIKCFNHTGQLGINDTKKEMNCNNVITKMSNLVKRYSKSKVALERFEYYQKELKLPLHDLLQRVPTRWNSEYIMMDRAVEQKLAIINECSAAGEDSLTSQEWKLAEGFVAVLRPLAEHTDEMGSEKKPTASMILPTIYEIISDLEDFIKNAPRGTGILFARSVLANMQKRFEYYENNVTLKIATLIDPRYRNILEDNTWIPSASTLLEEKAREKYRVRVKRGLVPFGSPNSEVVEHQTTAADVNSNSNTYGSGAGNPSPTPTCPSSASGQRQPSAKKPRWRHLQQKNAMRSGISEIDYTEKIKDEVRSYLMLPNIEANEDPLEWWKANQTAFPNLALVAKHYLGIAGTETAAERVASSGSNTVTNKRTNLSPDHIREIVFLHDNLTVPEMK